ncbi:YegP family protein [Haloarcula litorea]|uniref:YegP family protein n=1 Tax=Haloarcula litorea TaxID=3032579 RepID=UPI0023E7ADCD|nr:DUF1508 domain-containing protein [Halomicroarcula sp. GDY20]
MPSDSALTRWYEGRIGEPSTADEVRGYYLFVAGLLLGIFGLLLFFFSPANSGPREAGYVLGGLGLVLLVVGPTIRLPLSRIGTTVSYAGGVVCLVALLWFTTVYPANWERPTGNAGVVTLYVVGLFLTVVGALVAPALRDPSGEIAAAQEETRAAAQRADEAETETERATAERDELAEELATSESARGDLTASLEATEGELAAAQATIAAAMDSKGTFEVYADRGGKHRWRLRHRNGNVIADSAQGYASRQKAMQGLRSVQANAAGGAVVVLEDAAEDDEAAEVPEVPAPESQATFEVYEDNAGEYRWRLRHDNGEIIADGGEGYASKSNVRRALDGVRAHAAGAAYLRIDPTAFEVFVDAAGEYRWRLLHRNGEILADSGDGYASRSNARRAAARVAELAAESEVDDGFEVYEDNAGEYRWRLRAGNGELVADGGEGYTERNKALRAVERVRSYAPEADTLTIGSAAFEIYEDSADEWRWRLRHRNGEIVADSGEGYPKRSRAVAAIERVKRHAPGAEQSGD